MLSSGSCVEQAPAQVVETHARAIDVVEDGVVELVRGVRVDALLRCGGLAHAVGQERHHGPVEASRETDVFVEAALELLKVWFRDIALAQVGSDALVNRDLSPLALEAAARISPTRLQRRAVLIDEAKNAITARNGSVRLQLERMFIEMFTA